MRISQLLTIYEPHLPRVVSAGDRVSVFRWVSACVCVRAWSVLMTGSVCVAASASSLQVYMMQVVVTGPLLRMEEQHHRWSEGGGRLGGWEGRGKESRSERKEQECGRESSRAGSIWESWEDLECDVGKRNGKKKKWEGLNMGTVCILEWRWKGRTGRRESVWNCQILHLSKYNFISSWKFICLSFLEAQLLVIPRYIFFLFITFPNAFSIDWHWLKNYFQICCMLHS